MYKIIGADGKEYGPISTDILKKWLVEGRINAQTKVLPEGATEWKSLAEIPELAAALPTSSPAAMPMGYSTGLTPATDQTNAPGIALIVTGALNVLFGLARAAMSLLFSGAGALGGASGPNPQMERMMMGVFGTLGVVLGLVGALCGALHILGGIKMRKLESYGLCMTASILAMIPCTSPCCLIGLPIGIWAIVVLSKAEVKSQFH